MYAWAYAVAYLCQRLSSLRFVRATDLTFLRVPSNYQRRLKETLAFSWGQLRTICALDADLHTKSGWLSCSSYHRCRRRCPSRWRGVRGFRFPLSQRRDSDSIVVVVYSHHARLWCSYFLEFISVSVSIYAWHFTFKRHGKVDLLWQLMLRHFNSTLYSE